MFPCAAHYSRRMEVKEHRNFHRVKSIILIKLVALKLGVFFCSVLHKMAAYYCCGHINQVCEGRGTIVSLGLQIWTLFRTV